MKTFCLHIMLAAAMIGGPLKAAAQIAVLGDLIQVRVTAPGEVYTGEFVITNPTAEVQDTKIYQTDYLFFADGTTLYDDAGTLPRSNARWLSLSPTHVTILPGGRVPVRYTVTVPGGQALSGTYWSMIMIEGIPKDSPEAVTPTSGGRGPQIGLRPIIRYGMQVASHIQQTGARKAEFAGAHIVATEDGSRALEFDIRNLGERAYKLDVSVELYDEQGTSHGKRQQTHSLLYPGASVRERFDLSKLPPGTYKALIIADTGEEDVFGAQYKFKF